MRKHLILMTAVAAVATLTGAWSVTAEAAVDNGWEEVDGKYYWYEDGVLQGYDADDPDYRGREIYDPASDAWYWLDNAQGGARAVNKDVYQDSDGGKWVRYDADGKMVKGWQTTSAGTYYFDLTTGAMYKGTHTIDGRTYYFDETTGILSQTYSEGWNTIDGVEYWYESGVRQGTEGRGKEIYDSASDAWYWLDAVDGGKKAVSKDVYQESVAGDWGDIDNGDGTKSGKWVRYDSEGKMIKGWCKGSGTDAVRIDSPENAGSASVYYFDPYYGTMAKGWATIDGKEYHFDAQTGVLDASYGEVPTGGTGWKEMNGKWYWYENGVRQGVSDDSSYRGKEIYDSGTKAWYWLDNNSQGARAESKDVYQESDGGKWVRYDANGMMIKGWCAGTGSSATGIDALSEANGADVYYFDLDTGAMARGIVRIDGLDYVFDDTTGIYQGEYRGGTVSYVWVKSKASDYNTSGNLAGYTQYRYDDETGNLLSETNYNGAKARVDKTSYSYDSQGRQISLTYEYLYLDDTSEDYSIESTYDTSTGLLSKQVKKDGDGDVTEVHTFSYVDGKLNTEKIYTDETVKTLEAYLKYDYDTKGNATKVTRYDDEGNRLLYTTNTYYTYGGQTYLSLCLICDDDNKVLSGVKYEYNGAEVKKETVYTKNRVISSVTEYTDVSVPDIETNENYTSTSTTYDKDGNVINTTTYEYARLEIIS